MVSDSKKREISQMKLDTHFESSPYIWAKVQLAHIECPYKSETLKFITLLEVGCWDLYVVCWEKGVRGRGKWIVILLSLYSLQSSSFD